MPLSLDWIFLLGARSDTCIRYDSAEGSPPGSRGGSRIGGAAETSKAFPTASTTPSTQQASSSPLTEDKRKKRREKDRIRKRIQREKQRRERASQSMLCGSLDASHAHVCCSAYASGHGCSVPASSLASPSTCPHVLPHPSSSKRAAGLSGFIANADGFWPGAVPIHGAVLAPISFGIVSRHLCTFYHPTCGVWVFLFAAKCLPRDPKPFGRLREQPVRLARSPGNFLADAEVG